MIIRGEPDSLRLFALLNDSLDKWGSVELPPVSPSNPGQIVDRIPYLIIQETAFVNIPVPSFSETITDKDRNYIVTYGDTVENLYSFKAISNAPIPENEVHWTSLNPEIATINSNGVLSYVSTGMVTVEALYQGRTATKSVYVYSGTFSNSTVYESYKEGSLGHHVINQVEQLSKISTSLNLFSTRNDSIQNYVRNANCWLDGLKEELTCISVWNSTGGATRAGTLVTPRHIIFAKHFQINTGATIRFVGPDNQVVNRTMTAKANVGVLNTDFTLGVLDEDVPSYIKPCMLLPDNYGEWFATLWTNGLNSISETLVVGFDQQKRGTITKAAGISMSKMQHFTDPQVSEYTPFFLNKVGGDSGCPAFFVIDGKLVLLTTWTGGQGGAGILISFFITDINNAIDSLGRHGHALSYPDLSAFTNFA